MKYIIKRSDGIIDLISNESFNSYQNALIRLKSLVNEKNKQLSGEQKPYEIYELGFVGKIEKVCPHCQRTPSNGLKCMGKCVAESEY